MRRNNLTKLDVQLKPKSKTQLKTQNTSIETSFEDISFQNTNMRMDNQSSEPLMLTDGNSVKYGNLVTIKKTTKQRPKRLKINSDGFSIWAHIIIAIIFLFAPLLISFILHESFSIIRIILSLIGLAFVFYSVKKILYTVRTGGDLSPFYWEYKTVEKEQIEQYKVPMPNELYSNNTKKKKENVTTSMGVIYED